MLKFYLSTVATTTLLYEIRLDNYSHFQNPTPVTVALGFAVAAPTYGKIGFSRILSVNQISHFKKNSRCSAGSK